ncbi:hypothetical protein [Thiosulfatihalobacter marinus]|uniref:hypothetical protein n=1 Tax=Thiosulfatihalobacter marinus TaxID=2792481 RepID=UPI0018D99494|nr:hypothetical protein [Thiosulfatihalobacter marinus]
MTLPISFQTKLRRIEKDIDEAEREFEASKNVDALASDITDVIVKLHLLLDRAMNQIWEKYNSRKAGSGKPNIYFPVTTSSERFLSRLQKDQLHELHQKNALLFQLLEQIQPFHSENRWLEKLYFISSNRHERDAAVSERKEITGIGIGKGQNLYIRHMTVSNGQIFFDGDATNQTTGKKEPVRIEPTTVDRYLLEDLSIEAIPFARTSFRLTKTNLSKIFGSMK